MPHDQDPTQIGHFVPHDYTVGQGGFRTVLWEVPKYSRDLRAAIEDIVVFLNYLRKCYRDLNQDATAQPLVMCNRTAVHTQLLQHTFQAGGLRIATTSSAAGATARIEVVVQTGCGFLSGSRRGATMEDKEDCFGRATVALTRAIQRCRHLQCTTTGIIPLKIALSSSTSPSMCHLMQRRSLSGV